MASTKTSFDLSISSRTLPLLLLLLLGCCRLSSSAALRVADRWRKPCSGSLAVGDGVAEETVTMTTGEARDAFADLSRRSIVLKEIVNSLKNLYIPARFRSASAAEHWSNFAIDGSPQWTVSNGSIRETLLVCYENLARLAVLTGLTREGEQSAEARENHHFTTAFEGIEDHNDAGLYVLMCRLQEVMSSWGIQAMSPETVDCVASIRFNAIPNNAIRHGRDYIVLLVLETSADQLSSSFDRLVGQVHSQTTPATTQTQYTTSQ